LNEKEAKAQLWQMGVIGAWYLYDYQLPVYYHLRGHRYPLLETTRRFGKTTTDLVVALEDLIRNPGWVWRWCEPWKDQARKIVMPAMDALQETCPPAFRFKFYRTDSFYANRFDSKLYLLGVNEDKGESARGSFSNGITADELGSWAEPSYILNEVLRPQLLTTGGPLHELSTPPDDLGHFWYEEKARAINDGRFLQKTINDVDTISDAEKASMCAAVGGPQSPAWRREFLCEPVADPERLVIPEYDPNRHVIDNDTGRPAYFTPYVGLDLGFNDHTAALFGYFDFAAQTLIIEDELLVRGENSEQIANQAKAKEAALWGTLAKEPFRVGDNDRQQLHDLLTMCNYAVLPTRKDDKLAAITALRLRFTQGKIKIKARCESLLYQLKVGLWNERRTDFLRGEKTGHLDAIDALIYLSRNVNEHLNPFPQYGPEVIPQTHWINPSGASSEDADALSRAFRPLGSTGGRLGRS